MLGTCQGRNTISHTVAWFKYVQILLYKKTSLQNFTLMVTENTCVVLRVDLFCWFKSSK